MNFNEMMEEKRKRENNAITAEERIEYRKKHDAINKELVMGIFKEITKRDMTEAEYILYQEKFKTAKAGYNIRNFIEGTDVE